MTDILANTDISFKAECLVEGNLEWQSNMLRFATKEEAYEYCFDFQVRWDAVRKTRVQETSDPINATFHNRSLTMLSHLHTSDHRSTG